MRAEELTLNQLTAHDELAFTRNTARVLALVLPDIGEVGPALDLARNCVTVFCATRGQIPEVRTPEELIYHLTLEEIAVLAARCARGRAGWCENEGCSAGEAR